MSCTVIICILSFLEALEELSDGFTPALDSVLVFFSFASPVIFVGLVPFVPPLFVCMDPRLSALTKTFYAC